MSTREEPSVIDTLIKLQALENERTRRYLEYRRLYGVPPLSRREKLVRRVSSRWSSLRCRVALWIAPELDDY